MLFIIIMYQRYRAHSNSRSLENFQTKLQCVRSKYAICLDINEHASKPWVKNMATKYSVNLEAFLRALKIINLSGWVEEGALELTVYCIPEIRPDSGTGKPQNQYNSRTPAWCGHLDYKERNRFIITQSNCGSHYSSHHDINGIAISGVGLPGLAVYKICTHSRFPLKLLW